MGLDRHPAIRSDHPGLMGRSSTRSEESTEPESSTWCLRAQCCWWKEPRSSPHKGLTAVLSSTGQAQGPVLSMATAAHTGTHSPVHFNPNS